MSWVSDIVNVFWIRFTCRIVISWCISDFHFFFPHFYLPVGQTIFQFQVIRENYTVISTWHSSKCLSWYFPLLSDSSLLPFERFIFFLLFNGMELVVIDCGNLSYKIDIIRKRSERNGCRSVKRKEKIIWRSINRLFFARRITNNISIISFRTFSNKSESDHVKIGIHINAPEAMVCKT